MKKTIIIILSGILVALYVSLVSCGIRKKASNPMLIEGTWRIAKVDGQEVSIDKEDLLTISFDLTEKRFGGTGYCNSFGAEFTFTEKGDFSVGPILSTRMACPGLGSESAIFKALEESKKIVVRGNKALIYDNADAKNAPRLVLIRKKNVA